MLQRKGKLDKAAANLDEFKENMQHLASARAARSPGTRTCARQWTRFRSIFARFASEAQSAVTRVRDSLAK